MQSMTTYSGGWSASLVGESDALIRAAALARRFGTGLFLSSLLGLALGAREGGLALVTHALGVPAGVLAVTAIGVPALYIVLALVGASVPPDRLLDAAARACATTGLVHAGLAPAAALYILPAEEPGTASLVTALVLLVTGLIGLRSMLQSVWRPLREGDSATRLAGILVSLAFALFAVLLAARVWLGTLAVLGVAS